MDCYKIKRIGPENAYEIGIKNQFTLLKFGFYFNFNSECRHLTNHISPQDRIYYSRTILRLKVCGSNNLKVHSIYATNLVTFSPLISYI